jgi:hypothetical protein
LQEALRDVQEFSSSDFEEMRLVDDIPVAHTPPRGYSWNFPKPVLAGCPEPLFEGAPDLGGIWQVIDVEVNGKRAPKMHRALNHFERVEQCGDRIVITGGGVVHDMRCDGTTGHGVNDVAARNFKTKIKAITAYENGVHVLRPVVGFRIRLLARLLGYNLVITCMV